MITWWPVWLLEIAATTVLLWYVFRSPQTPKLRQLLFLALGLGLAINLLSGVAFGYGHTWDVASFVGKFLASLVMFSLPLILVAGTVFLCSNRKMSKTTIAVMSYFAVILGTAPVGLVGLILVCSFTSDCL